MERMLGEIDELSEGGKKGIPQINSQLVESLLGANATRHILYLLDGQYLYQTQNEDGSIQYKFLSSQSVRLAFSKETVDSGWLPPQLCRWGYGKSGQWAIMFIPPAKHKIWLMPNTLSWAEPLPETPTPTGPPQPVTLQNGTGAVEIEVYLPGLVFAGIAKDYYLWATKDKESSLIPHSLAYHVPLPNVHPTGNICWGQNQVETVTSKNLEAAWKLFISSPFNLHLVAGKSKSEPENVVKMLAQIRQTTSNSKKKAYPLKDLLPITNGYKREAITISTLVEHFIQQASER